MIQVTSSERSSAALAALCRRVVRAVRMVLAGCALLLTSCSTAQATVGLRSSAAASSSTVSAANSLSLTLPKPAGLAVDDLMLVTGQWVLKTANGSTVTASPPAGWTELDNNNQTGWAVEIWWKRATAADVAATSFTFSAAWANRQGIAAGVISAYSGVVRTGSPLAWGQVQRTGFNAATVGNGQYGMARPGDTTYSAPAYTPVPGSLGVTAVMADRSNNANQLDLTSVANSTLVASQPATGGGGTDGINTAVAYAAPDASGTYLNPYTQMTFANTIQWTAFSLVLQPTPCGAGGLNLGAAPASIVFPTTTLTASDQSVTTSATLTVNDQTEDGTSSSGWSLAINPTQFSTGTTSLSANALSVTSASSAAGAVGRCSAATNSISYTSLTLPAGSATKVFNAAPSSGRGASDVTIGLALAIPATTRVGTYTSTWTMTLATGP